MTMFGAYKRFVDECLRFDLREPSTRDEAIRYWARGYRPLEAAGAIAADRDNRVVVMA